MIRVLIVDDSLLIQSLLEQIINDTDDMTVVGKASDPYQARTLIKELNPDVLTLDVEMPRMDGLSFLKNLMRLRPMPVVMISTLTQQGAPITLEALEVGAVDFVAKPTQNVVKELNDYAQVVQQKIRAAAYANVQRYSQQTAVSAPATQKGQFKINQLVAIGASTGGTEAIKSVLCGLPENFPATVITQHIPPVFSHSFAQRMDRACAMSVCEAQDGQKIEAGHVYIAPGDQHLKVVNRHGQWQCCLSASEPVNRHRPSVDVLFESIAAQGLAKITTAVLLTGMGYDGAKGLLTLRQNGSTTGAQDERTSVVWGMPKAAIELNAAENILALERVPQWLITQAQK